MDFGDRQKELDFIESSNKELMKREWNSESADSFVWIWILKHYLLNYLYKFSYSSSHVQWEHIYVLSLVLNHSELFKHG